MKLTHVIAYMHPRAGGPPVVVDRLCREQLLLGQSPTVVTTTALAAGDANWRMDRPYRLEVHDVVGPAGFAYSPGLARALPDLVADSDLVHVHGLWTYPGWRALAWCRRLGVPAAVMPHGMLDPHSLGRKWVKKQVYGRLVEWPALRRASGMIYTCAEERRLAESATPGMPPGWVVPLASEPPPADRTRVELAASFRSRFPSLKGRPTALFLSRLHPKKGLDLLLVWFAELARRDLLSLLTVRSDGVLVE